MKAILLVLVYSFYMIHHPMILSIILIMISLSVAFLLPLFSNFSWSSYIISLILIGAMLIIFIYLASLAPNEIFISYNKTTFIMLSTSIFFLSFIIPSPPSLSQPNLNLLTQLFFSQGMFLILILAVFLLITMIAVVKITSLPEGPLKSKLN
uniref:NADH dehydrogenase subunit 6 n=1 Tax=Phrynus sp. 1 SEM-2008 TaxID=507471 RepID=B2CKE3_9ARAC|nr:NADH dehydrogenase subunit 6 [Phrynus sp. 1 SEM-2008]